MMTTTTMNAPTCPRCFRPLRGDAAHCAVCTAKAEGVAPVSIGELFFSYSGRIGRLHFFIGLVGLNIAGFLFGLFFASVDPPPLSGDEIVSLWFLVAAWPFTALIIKRLHDFNWSGWGLIVLLIPLANLVLWLALFFGPGTTGGNDHGHPRPFGTARSRPLAMPSATSEVESAAKPLEVEQAGMSS